MREMRQDRIALDRAPSSRSVDSAGHMRVLNSAVSCANVCGYVGSEIPGFESLGLDPGKVYRLYRDAKSLKDSAQSLNGKPLVILHRAQVASDHDNEIVVGALDNARWDAPFLRADLTIWSQDGIDLVTSGEQRDLSCGYFYVPTMSPGISPEGESFDGTMTAIEMNHCCLVSEGRVKGAFVGDAAIRRRQQFARATKRNLFAAPMAKGAATDQRFAPRQPQGCNK